MIPKDLFYLRPLFFGLRDGPEFIAALRAAVGTLHTKLGTFAGDNLFAMTRNLSFLTDEKFIKAFRAHAKTNTEQGTIWRVATNAWAASNGLRLEGDFVECACYKGVTARIICDYTEIQNELDRK